jgi:hypothetical protein
MAKKQKDALRLPAKSTFNLSLHSCSNVITTIEPITAVVQALLSSHMMAKSMVRQVTTKVQPQPSGRVLPEQTASCWGYLLTFDARSQVPRLAFKAAINN